MLARLPYCISIPKPLLGSVLRQTVKILALIEAKVARHCSDDTIGLVDLCTREDTLASIHEVQYFRTAVSSAWSNSEVGRAVQISSLTFASRV
jgi:hypothetical protein